MADVTFASQYWQVRSEAPGVPEPILVARYAQAVKDFMHQSEAWRLTLLNPVAITSGQAFPTLSAEIPAYSYLLRPVSIRFTSGGASLPFAPRDQLELRDTMWEAAVGPKPEYWTITQPGVFRFYPMPDVTTPAALLMRVALGVRQTATGIPEGLMREHDTAFAAGALMNILKMPGKDWTNLDLAAAYAEQFDTYIALARSKATNDYSRPGRTVRYGGL